jgi:hypothetical protein
MIRSPGNGVLKRIAAHLAVLALLLVVVPASADEQAERRVLMGLKLLPALMAADQDLAQKRARDGALNVVLLYREDVIEADKAAKRLSTTQHIGKLPLRVTTLPYARLATLNSEPPAALFLVEFASSDLAAVARFGSQHQRLVFSPFKGDVSAGIQTGIHVAERILPVVNTNALAAANIRLKPFLLEVARTHE